MRFSSITIETIGYIETLADSLQHWLASQPIHNHLINAAEAWIIGESRKNVENVLETENRYQGITLNERMALRHIFDKEEEDLTVPEQFPDILLPIGSIKWHSRYEILFRRH